MRISRARRGPLSIPMAVILLLTLSPTVAQAGTNAAQFNVSTTSGRPGVSVLITQGDACPDLSNEIHQHVDISFTDAAGNQVDFGTGIAVGNDGSWNHSTQLRIPATAAQGAGIIEARCTYWDGTGGATSLQYEPRAYTVSGTPPQFTTTPTTVQPGAAVTLTSVDSCPSDRLGGSISNDQQVSNIYKMLDSTGAWTVEVPASSENMDGTRTPFAPGPYTIQVYCLDDMTAHVTQLYLNQQVTVGESTPPVSNCRDVIFIAAAGSGQQFDGPRNLSVSPELEHAYKGFRQVLPTDKKIKIRVINYPALPVETLTRRLKLNEYLDSKNKGVNRLRSEVTEARLECPNRPIVLAGYSQGALVVHEFMVEHAAAGGEDIQSITAAILLGNPARHANSPVVDFGEAPWDSKGICQFFSGGGCFKTMPFGDIPQVYQARTTSVCLNFDIVCDTSHLVGVGAIVPKEAYEAGVRAHTSYDGMPVTKLAGKRAARQVMKLW